VVEAMQFGKPLFLSNKTSLPEIGGDVAFYFHDFNPDHMQHLFQNGLKQYEAGNLKEKILQRGKDFSWEISARKYVDVYYSLL
jgi:glycosyltransferase involved in cell wall biosynthesis